MSTYDPVKDTAQRAGWIPCAIIFAPIFALYMKCATDKKVQPAPVVHEKLSKPTSQKDQNRSSRNRSAQGAVMDSKSPANKKSSTPESKSPSKETIP